MPALLLLAAAGPCFAQAASAPAAAPKTRPHVTVIEDDNVRIEETRVRGQLQRIVVHDKTGKGKSYEIIVPPGGKDPSTAPGTAGQRAWSLFSF